MKNSPSTTSPPFIFQQMDNFITFSPENATFIGKKPYFFIAGIPGLLLDSSTLHAILSGTIKQWNHPSLQKLNPSVDLPSKDIRLLHSNSSCCTSAVVDNKSSPGLCITEAIPNDSCLPYIVSIKDEADQIQKPFVPFSKNSNSVKEYKINKAYPFTRDMYFQNHGLMVKNFRDHIPEYKKQFTRVKTARMNDFLQS